MAAIHLLDEHTAELIAAGEVVERPASVVKELVENAIDAGASSITVEIERGGISLIRIQDDGEGIAAGDLPLAFVRHATSKVRTQDDLEAIATLGFRGEALASIASVAQVELLTKTDDSMDASLYRIEGGKERGLDAAARPRGTTLTIRNLFFNTPARMKFLKKDASEGTFVTETVGRLALSHPGVAFRYLREGKPVFSTPGDGELASAAYAVLGAAFARDLLAVEGEKPPYTVRGLITSPLHARASRSMQYFYINGRFVKNRTMMAALEQAYRGTTMQGKFPGCVLFLSMPPQLVDVNVHPAKTEVRFARESDVFEAIYRTVKETLLQNQGQHGRLDLTAGKEAPQEPLEEPPQQIRLPTGVFADNRPEKPGAAAVQSYNRMTEALASEAAMAPYESRNRGTQPPGAVPFGEQKLDIEPDDLPFTIDWPKAPAAAEKPAPPEAAGTEIENATTAEDESDEGDVRLVGEVFTTYIVAQVGEVLLMIDKHAAHERILYEELVQKRQDPAVQQLLAPAHLSLSAREKEALLQNSEALEAAGIEVEDFGAGGVLVRGVPADIDPGDVEGLVQEVAAHLATGAKEATNSKTEWVLHSIACRAAIKAGDRTPPGQLLQLALDIYRGKVPPFCPHGRPVVLEMTRKELEKQFGRLG